MRLAVSFFRIFKQSLGLVIGLGLLSLQVAQAQAPELHCLMLPLEPAVRARQATVVVEAQVLDAQSFWDVGHGRLFTRHRLRVFSLLKGQVTDTTGLTLITEGGRLGLDQQILTNTLRLASGQQGIFFLVPAPWRGLSAPASTAFTPFGSEQGFIEYNVAERTAVEPFRTYPAIDAAFYQVISQLTGQPRQVLLANAALSAGPVAGSVRRGLAPTISGFTPASLPAGAEAVLTISGDGFGSSRGSGFVEFKNADDGGATRVKAREADYLSWTNTRIQVRVPSAGRGGSPVSGGRPAGSGIVRITTPDQATVESASPVTIIYAITNVENTDGTLLQRTNHIALNAAGGITFRFGPNFSASPAASWQRALATWRCQTGMNWEVGPTNASNTITSDGQNVVAFDAGAELPAQVLGRTTSYYGGCYAPSGEVVFWVKEIDMQFDDATNWQFGPALAVAALNQLDFETVAVHELGHAQQLSHLILPGAVMHYAVARGQNTRALNPLSDVAGGRQVLRGRSFKTLGCGGPAMLPAPLIGLAAQFTGAVGVTLAWSTRDECFLSGFVVERSLSGDTTSGWARLGTITSRPPGGQYQFIDAQPPGGLHYYRLRLLRPDNSLDAAAPIVLSTDATNVSIFPNPVADDQLRLQYPTGADGTVIFRIYDMLGRRARSLAFNVPSGLNVLSLDVAGLVPGLYVLQWQDARGKVNSQKFVRQ